MDEEEIHPNNMMLKKFEISRWRFLNVLSPDYANLIHVPTGIDIRTCGHFVHFKCFREYIRANSQDSHPVIDPLEWYVKVPCPACREVVHCILPTIPDFNFKIKRLQVITRCYDKTFLAEKVNSLIWCGIRDFNGRIFQRLRKQGIRISFNLSPRNKITVGDERTKYVDYEELFANFINLCHKWTRYWRHTYCDDLRQIQASAIGIIKGHCERNVLLTELNFTQITCSEMPTKFMIYGARYKANKMDLKLAKYEWKKLTFGFMDEQQDVLPELDSNQQSGSTPPDEPSQPVDDEFSGDQASDEINIPMILFDFKTTLIRLSVYVISSDWIDTDEKRVLLSFIYQMILVAIIFRTAVFAAIRMPFSQILETNFMSLSNEVFTLTVKRVVQKLFFRTFDPVLNIAGLLSHNTDAVDFEAAFQYACTDISRLTAQLWHECGMQIFEDHSRIGVESFSGIYKLLTGENELSLELMPEVHIEQWTEEVIHSIKNLKNFPKRLRIEPLTWRRFVLFEPPKNYSEIFLRSCFRQCIRCQGRATHQYLCLLCGQLLNMDRRCYDVPKCLILHGKECGNSGGCFLSLKSKTVLVVLGEYAAFWGDLYFDINGEFASTTTLV
uniref:E3 ubiquitin-protein ligase n=1 Tax=Setaria digitata TaxID=48799 RepID=A0A915PGA3_9BILA